jgi:hypothetical protein
MPTAIFVYESTSLNISTCETDLELCGMELCGMDTSPIALSPGPSAQPVVPGIYKILSSQAVEITGDRAAFDVTPYGKTDGPPLPPRLVSGLAPPLDATAVNAFFVTPEAKVAANP